MTGGDASTTMEMEHFDAACCISHEFHRRASRNPNRIAVIHACGGARLAREFHRIHKNDSGEQTIIGFDEVISEKTTSLRPTVYEGDRCFTFSDILSAVDSLSSRLRRILDGANDSHLIKPRSGNGVLRDHLVQVENSESLESSAQQFNELQKTYTPRVIGVYMEPSIEYIITVLSVLRCGEAFMPLDPSWPKERILWVLSSSKANLLVGCGSSVDSNFHQLDKLDWLIDDGSCPIFRISMEDYIQKKDCDSLHLVWPCERERWRSFCYLMYTSGSTGEPKGVCGTEAGISGSSTCYLIVAVPSFMRAILPALESAYFRRIQSSLKVLVLSGETFHLSLWKILVKILPQTAILNLYGSTEVSGDCTYFDCESLPLILEHESLSGVPIGLPLQNCDVLLLGDDDPNEGEICVSGLCLSAGYFCYPSVLPLDYVELSQNHDSKSTDHRVQQYFRTGDFARKLQNGNFIFLGRKDRTVKISGHRIALEEVESVLREHPEVADAAVIFRNDKRDTSLLEAHLIMKENNEHVEILRSITNWIARKLPPAMIPVRFFFIESFPMSSSGKVDYNLLADSCVCNAGFHSEVDETQDIDFIQAIEKAFCDGLRVDKISHNADFFEMGGNSISAAYVSYTLGINMKDLYTFPTPKKLQMALLRKEISFNHDLRSGAPEGVNYEGQGNSNILSLYSREPHHNRRMPLNENSFKRLKMDSNLYIESNYVSARDYSYSNLDLINCSFSRCNYVKHGEECGGNICGSVRSQEFPCGRKISIREFWKVDMESCVDASPLVVYKESNVYVFIGSHSQKFICIDAKSGVVQWMVELQGRIECSAAIVGDFSQVVVGCYEGNIYFLNFSNGSTCWSYQTCGEVKSQPVVDKPRHLVWCGSHDHNLYALDYKNYCCIFKIPCGGSVFGSPAVDEMQGKLYVASTSGRVTAVSIKAQLYSVLWIKELGVPVFGSLSINFSYEIVICCLVDGSVLALDASGSVVWKGRTGGPIFAGPCTSHTLPSQVLICSRDGIIYSFDLENGKLLWKHSVEDPITASAYIDESLLLSCDDHTLPRRFICVCTSSGGIRVLQVNLDHNEAAKQSGEDVIQEFAKLDLEGDIFSSPVMIGGTIFVGCRDDYVHCLKLER